MIEEIIIFLIIVLVPLSFLVPLLIYSKKFASEGNYLFHLKKVSIYYSFLMILLLLVMISTFFFEGDLGVMNLINTILFTYLSLVFLFSILYYFIKNREDKSGKIVAVRYVLLATGVLFLIFISFFVYYGLYVYDFIK